MQQFDLILVGGGLAGASFALALRNTRLRIALVENHVPSRSDDWDARVYAISPANAAFLEYVGAWQHLVRDRLSPIHGMQVYGDAGGELGFSAFDSGVSELGWIVESSQMACEFWEGLKRQSNVTLFCPGCPADLSFTGAAARLELTDGQVLAAPLVVGADGRDSWIRNAAGLAAINTPYGEKGVVANFVTEKPHRQVAYQWFRDDGVLACLPLPGNRISIVWSTPDDNADELCRLPDALLCERVAESAYSRFGALELLTPPLAFPLRLMQVKKTVRPRLALIGDAAHGIHPLSGHGINLGFQDARVLAELLTASQPWHDIGQERFLQRYQRTRREETLLMQKATHTLRHLFRDEWPGLRPLRNIGLNLTNGIPFIKNSLVRYALGAF